MSNPSLSQNKWRSKNLTNTQERQEYAYWLEFVYIPKLVYLLEDAHAELAALKQTTSARGENE